MKMMFIQPTDKMKKVLDEEGLNIDWPKGKVDIASFAIDGYFYTGAGDWEKAVVIDLRDKEITNAKEADKAIADQLQVAYDNYDVGEEFKIYIGVRGAPEAETLWEDLKEAKDSLKRFAELAYAVCRGKEIPPEKTEEKKVEITLEKAKQIVEFLKVGWPMEEVFKRNERHSLVAYMKMVIQECE